MSKPRREYNVVKRHRLHTLVEDMNLLAEEGWIPEGGISVAVGGEVYSTYCQAITRLRPEDATDERACSVCAGTGQGMGDTDCPVCYGTGKEANDTEEETSDG